MKSQNIDPRIYIICTNDERWFYNENPRRARIVHRATHATRYTYREALATMRALNAERDQDWTVRVCARNLFRPRRA